MLDQIVIYLCWGILWYLIIISIGYVVLLIASIPDIILSFKEADIGNIISLLKSRQLPPVTVIMVSYNEMKRDLINSMQSVLTNDYINTKLIVVNNDSTDNTLSELKSIYDLEQDYTPIHRKVFQRGTVKGVYQSRKYSNLTVIDKTDKDKSDGLNVALNACVTPIFITIDADTLIEPDAISKILFPMLTKSHTIAVGGSVYILNGCKYKDGKIIEAGLSFSPLYALQTCEYLRSFMFGRAGWNTFGGSLSYSGAFTLFETQAVIENHGFQLDNFSNDLEVILHLQATKYEKKYPYKIYYTPAAIAWTDVPGTLNEYFHQRTKWQYGSQMSFFGFKRMFFNPKYGIMGLYVYPFFLTAEIFGHIVELLAYLTVFLTWYLGILNIYWAILLFVVCWGFVTFLTISTTCLSLLTFNKYRKMSTIFTILFYSIVEQFGFRQYNLLCRLWGTLKYFKDQIFHSGKVNLSEKK